MTFNSLGRQLPVQLKRVQGTRSWRDKLYRYQQMVPQPSGWRCSSKTLGGQHRQQLPNNRSSSSSRQKLETLTCVLCSFWSSIILVLTCLY